MSEQHVQMITPDGSLWGCPEPLVAAYEAKGFKKASDKDLEKAQAAEEAAQLASDPAGAEDREATKPKQASGSSGS